MEERSSSDGATRREFISGSAAVLTSERLLGGQGTQRRIPVGVIGCGQRGAWITGLFARHGGFDIHAVADYFPDVADRCGELYGVPPARRFSGLRGYERLLGSGVEAVALETPPYCFPDHAWAAVQAGKHVFMAKPVAVDVPGCRRVEQAALEARKRGLVFLVDYQMPTDPGNIRVVEAIRKGVIGEIVAVHSYYLAGAWPDPPKGRTIEDRLQRLIWVNDTAIGSGYHGNACIHAIDAVLWAVGKTPVGAVGMSRIGRPDPHGDSHDVLSLTYDFGGGLFLNHRAKHLPDRYSNQDFCGCYIHGTRGYARLSYGGRAELVSDADAFAADVENLYEAGAVRNIAAFYEAIQRKDAGNPTVRRSIAGALTTIMGREAALRRRPLTMASVLRENKRLPLDLRGLRE